MTSIATGLARALPKPKHSSDNEEPRVQQRGPRIVAADQIDETQIVVKVCTPTLSANHEGSELTCVTFGQRAGPPPYPNRSGWRPRAPEDFGDGGAFPEIPVAQYPWGKNDGSSKSNALVVQVDSEGKVDYSAIARQGHSADRIIHTSFKDLIPLRQRAEAGDLDLSRPSQEQVAETAERTKKALETLVNGALAAQKPKNVNVGGRREPTFVKYTPSTQMGDNSKKQERIIKIVERQKGMPFTRSLRLRASEHQLTSYRSHGAAQVQAQEDPERTADSSAAGMFSIRARYLSLVTADTNLDCQVMHSPPRKLTAEDQEAWRIRK